VVVEAEMPLLKHQRKKKRKKKRKWTLVAVWICSEEKKVVAAVETTKEQISSKNQIHLGITLVRLTANQQLLPLV
jgi:hypothetical protein